MKRKIKDDDVSEKDQLKEDPDAYLESPIISECKPIDTNNAIFVFASSQPHHSETQYNVESLKKMNDTMKVNTISTEETSPLSKETETMGTTPLTDSHSQYFSALVPSETQYLSENIDATSYRSAISSLSLYENHSLQYQLAHEQLILHTST